MTVIERAARALRQADQAALPSGISTVEERDQFYREAARAVLQAIREPTPGMLAAAKPEPTHLYGIGGRDDEYQRRMKAATAVAQMSVRSDWQAMIDAALEEE